MGNSPEIIHFDLDTEPEKLCEHGTRISLLVSLKGTHNTNKK